MDESRKNLCIIQPGRMGDIIICLPIARYYFDQGYDIIWPVLSEYYSMFRDIDYVKAIELKCGIHESVLHARKHCDDNCQELDLSFGFPNSRVSQYQYNTNYADNFVYAKYKLAKVPISERWNLKFNRDVEREGSLYDKVVKHSDYILLHGSSSRGKHITADEENIVEVNEIEDYNIFNWMKVIEDAAEIRCVDSSICNLIESQKHLNSKIKKYIPAKQHAVGWGRTTLENNWIVCAE